MMSSEFDITLDDNKFTVCVDRLDEGGLLVVKVGEESYTIKATQNEDGSWTLNDTTSDYSIKILKKTSSMLSVEIDNQPREIAWQRIMKKQTTSTPQTASVGGPKVSGGVYPPMPGKITEVHVKVGDTVDTYLYLGEGWASVKKGQKSIAFDISVTEPLKLKTVKNTKVDEWLEVQSGKLRGFTQDAPFELCFE